MFETHTAALAGVFTQRPYEMKDFRLDLITRLEGEVANLMAIADTELGSTYLGTTEGSEIDEAANEVYGAIYTLEEAVTNLKNTINEVESEEE